MNQKISIPSNFNNQFDELGNIFYDMLIFQMNWKTWSDYFIVYFNKIRHLVILVKEYHNAGKKYY